MPNVMIVTENGNLKTLLVEFLASTPYHPLEVSSNSSLSDLEKASSELEAVMIGDNSQSRDNFLNAISRFRQALPIVPIIAIANSPDIRFVVQAMQAGADTFLLQSDLDSVALLASIGETREASLERLDKITSSPLTTSLSEKTPQSTQAEEHTAAIIQIDDLVINNHKLSASFQETMLDLSPTEFEILSFMAHSAGQVITFEELVYQVYGLRTDRDQARRTLAAHISNLRGKLRDAGAEDYLVNRRGRGYLIEREAITFSLPDNQHVEHYKQALEILTSQIPSIAICLYDRDGNIIVSKGQILAEQIDESGGQVPTVFSFAEKRANFEHQLHAVFSEKASHFEHENQDNNYTIDLLPVTTGNGDIPMGMILVQDISTLKQLDSLVSGEIEELTSRIMAQVTSEIRTTLTTLQTSTDLLVRYRDRISEEEQFTRLNQIHAQVDQLVEYFEAISSLSQTFSNRTR